MTTPDQIPQRYRRDWTAFTRWCTALGHTPLPAAPATVLAFLHDHPARPATQRARVTAIDTAHRHAGLPAPGRAETVRTEHNPQRAARRARTIAAVDALLPGLPTRGWVRGLFGRRDAALLVLAAAGLSFPQLAVLRQHQLQITDTTVHIDGNRIVLAARPDDPLRCPVQILRRWTAVLNLAPTPAGPYLLSHHLRRDTVPATPLLAEWAAQPVLTSFTANGYPTGDLGIGRLRPLTVTAVHAIARAHLLGTPPRHRHLPQPADQDADTISEPLPPPCVPDLDPGYHDAGVAARHRDRPLHDELDSLLDDLETRIAAAISTQTELFTGLTDL